MSARIIEVKIDVCRLFFSIMRTLYAGVPFLSIMSFISILESPLSLFAIGFSIISAVLLALGHLTCRDYRGRPFARFAGLMLLLGLSGLQFSHFLYFQGDSRAIYSVFYQALLFIVAPSFYFFVRDVFNVSETVAPSQQPFQAQWLLHAFPLLIGVFLARSIALPLAFLIGALYVAWLAKSVYALRAQRKRFKQELMALAAMFVVAFLVLLLGIFMPLVSERFFYTTYSLLIGLAFFLALWLLIRFPMIGNDVAEAAQAAYAQSSLKNLDGNALELKLRQLMEVDKLFTQETLSLGLLAEQMEISSHQLSELINTRFGKSFSQMLREYRVAAAKRMLLEEPEASVLSIGLSSGFNSQSSFYTAFREISGMAPGAYRKKKSA